MSHAVRMNYGAVLINEQARNNFRFWVIGFQRRPLLLVFRQIKFVGEAGVNRHVLWTSINSEPLIFWAPEETSINRHVLWTSINPHPVIFWTPEETP